ncbi:MAG: hypothetical protein ACQEUY_13175 [Pseudomonadota bacterium]
MSKRALRLHQLHSREELVSMLERVKSDSENLTKEASLHLYNKRARQLLDDIGWALYWHARPSGNTRMAPAKPKAKWW